MIRSVPVVLVALAVALFCLPNTTTAQIPAYQPAGVGVGETYHLAFISSGTIYGWNNDITHFNNHVDTLGSGSAYNDLNTVPGSWKAVVSTISAADGSLDPGEAVTNAPVSGDVYRVDGVQVSDFGTANDFYQPKPAEPANIVGHLAPISIGENGADYSLETSWSGSHVDGTRRPGDELGAADTFANVGQPGKTDAEWLDRSQIGHVTQVYSNWFRFYGLSEPLVGVPEPSTGILLGSGLIGLLLYARRKR